MRKDTSLFLFSAVATAVLAVSLLPAEVRRAAPSPSGKASVGTIAPAEAYANLGRDGNILLLDVRTPAEYAERRIPGSILVPLDGATPFAEAIRKRVPDVNAVVYVYCRSGRRSRAAADIMAKLGYRRVYDLGGINDWPYATESGAPVK